MAVDWFTVVAQLVNFMILVGLLQRYLYRPILGAMDEREKLVAARFAEAAQAREKAEHEQKEWAVKAAGIDGERTAVLERARAEAEANRVVLQQAAEAAATARTERWIATQARAQATFRETLERRAQHEALVLARGIIPAFTGVDLDARALEVFLARLDALPPEERARLHTGLVAGPSIVRTATELTDAGRGEVSRVLAAACPGSAPPTFEVDPELLCGVELAAGDWKLRWSIGDYLAKLETEIALPNPQEAGTHVA